MWRWSVLASILNRKAKELGCKTLQLWTKRSPAAFIRRYGYLLTGYMDGHHILDKELDVHRTPESIERNFMLLNRILKGNITALEQPCKILSRQCKLVDGLIIDVSDILNRIQY